MFQCRLSTELHSDWLAAPAVQLLLTWRLTCLPEPPWLLQLKLQSVSEETFWLKVNTHLTDLILFVRGAGRVALTLNFFFQCSPPAAAAALVNGQDVDDKHCGSLSAGPHGLCRGQEAEQPRHHTGGQQRQPGLQV